MLLRALTLALVLVSSCTGRAPADTRAPLSLAALPLEPDVKASGARLMAAPPGLHLLARTGPKSHAVVAVHGARSEGYEWIYPLHALASQGTLYVYRYDDRACPGDIATSLAAELTKLANASPALTGLRVVGHSYGGVVTASAAAAYTGRTPLSVDLIAAPLAGLSSLGTRCHYDFAPVAQKLGAVTVRQWRTQKALDRAFQDLATDPQDVAIPGARVVTLPASYRGERLGHNWSISWVVEQPLAP